MSASADQAQQRWRVTHRGQDYGSYTRDALRERIIAGRIAPDAQLTREGSSDPPISVADFLGTQKLEPASELSQQELDLLNPEKGPPPAASTGPAVPTGEAEAADMDMADSAAAEAAGDTHIGMPAVSSSPGTTIEHLGRLWWENASPIDGVVRDRIVILGRRQSGKTIYLASLYAMLWDRLTGLGARASTGAAHRQLMSVARSLKACAWPVATQGTIEVPLVVDYGGIRQAMVVLDYAGELFTKAFFRDQIDAREVAPLLQHIDHAAAVILLVDPMVTVGLDHEAIMEDDFGLVQAVQRIRESPGGKEVPVVFVLTKADAHADVVNKAGGLVEFVRRHFASLARLLGQLQIYQVSAVQTEAGPDGQSVPRADSMPFNIEKPLIYCMEMIAIQRQKQQVRQKHEAAMQAYEESLVEERIVQRKQNRQLAVVMVLILLAGMVAIALIIWLSAGSAPAAAS